MLTILSMELTFAQPVIMAGTGFRVSFPQISRPALQEGFRTPSTSASRSQDSEPGSESSQRRDENTIHVSARKRSPQSEQVDKLAGSDSSGVRFFSDLAQTGFNQSQSSVSDDNAGKNKASDEGTEEVCTMCKIKPAAMSLTVILHLD